MSEGGRPSLSRSALIYGLSNTIERAIPALLLLVLTHFLTREDFGRLAIYTALVGIATPLVGLNVASAVRRRYFEADRSALPRYVGNAILIVLMGVTSGLLLALGWWGVVGTFAGLGIVWMLAAVLDAGARSFIAIPLNLWQVEHQPGRYATVQVGRAAVASLLTAVLVLGLGMDWRGAALGAVTTSVLFVGWSLPGLRTWVELTPDAASRGHAVRYGGGLIIHTLGMIAISSADRFFIDHHVGAAETGVYFVAYQIGFVVIMAADAFNRAWSPWLFESLTRADPGLNRRIVGRIYLFMVSILALAAVVVLLAPLFVPLVLGAAFAGAERFVWWIALGFAFNGMYRVVAGLVFYSQRTMVLSWITGGAALINLALNAVLVPRLGALGAAQATAVAYFISFVLTWFATRRVQPMPWATWRRASR